MTLRSLLFLPALIILVALPLSAQQRPAFGVYGDYSLNTHAADFQKLPGVPNCCPRFESGSGGGIAFGVLYQLPLSPLLALQLRGGYHSLDGELTTTEPTTVLHDGAATAGEFTHRLDATLSTIGIEPLVGIWAVGDLRVNLGLRAGLLISKKYDQREEISKPDGAGTFLDSLGNDSRSRVRNQSSGDIPDASSFQMALLGGVSYTLPLNARRTLFASPEVIYSYGITNVASSLKWSVHSLRLGVALTHSPAEQEEMRRRQIVDTVRVERPGVVVARVVPGRETRTEESEESGGIRRVTEVIRRTDTLLVAVMPRAPVLTATVTANGVEATGVESPVVRMTIEEFSSTLMTPLLHYLFFDENSASIPGRYQSLQSDDIDTFNIDHINSPAKLPTYHHLLNIVGRRLQDNPNARVTLTGCNQDIREEKGNLQLSRQRAEAVREYLKNVWGIADGRMKIEARNLSAKAANTQTQDGAEENRRVEITSDDPRILAPIITNDTLRTSNPPSVRFKPTVYSQAGVVQWELNAVQDGRRLKHFEGKGDVPPEIVWNVNDDPGSIPKYAGDMLYSLSVFDAAGGDARAENTIPVEQMTISRKRVERRGDKEIDRSSLILFDVRSSDISSAGNAIVPLIKERIQPASTVSVTGYTDRLGEAAYNQQLAESRAAAVAKALGAVNTTSTGIGQADLYDSSLPEGRLYTRTVDVVIETPVNK